MADLAVLPPSNTHITILNSFTLHDTEELEIAGLQPTLT